MTSRSLAALAALLSSAALAAAQTAPGPTAAARPTVILPNGAEKLPDAADAHADGRFAAPVDSHADDSGFTASAEYLAWWIKNARPALPLLTTGGAGGGVLGASDTHVLFRLSDLPGDDVYNGGRITLGCWICQDSPIGFDVDFFALDKRTFSFGAASDAGGSPLLSVPFNDLNPAINGPSFTAVSVPGVIAGGVQAISTTRLWGVEADFKAGLVRSAGLSVDGLVGFRQADLTEKFAFTQDVRAITGTPLLSFEGNPVPAADSLQIADRLDAHNTFYGLNLGLRTTWSPFARLAVDLTTKVALGTVTQRLDVFGSTTHFTPGGTAIETAPGGLFALWAANSGSFTRSKFAVLPEAVLRLRYSVTDWLDLSVGYDFLFWSSVVRPANQVSGTINSSLAPSQVPFANGGPVAPLPAFHRTDFSAQGLNLGFEVRF